MAPDILDSIRRTIRDVPDFPKPGILFKDITPVLANPTLTAKTVRLSLDRQRLAFDGALTVRDEYRDRDLPDWETKGVEVPAESFAILTIAPVKI